MPVGLFGLLIIDVLEHERKIFLTTPYQDDIVRIYQLDREAVFISKENTTSYIILGLLAHEVMTGYAMKKRIEISIKNFWDVGLGQIYPTLKTLEFDRFIERASKTVSEKDNKILYTITDKGKKHLVDWLENAVVTEYVKYEVILKLFFGSKISYQHNKERVTDFLNNSKQKLETAEEVSDKLLKIIDEDDDHFYYYLTTLFGKHIYKAYINWAEEVNQLLDSKNDGN